MQKELWAVRNVNDPYLYWNNELGWVEGESIEVFTKRDMEDNPSLPIGGEWVRIYPQD